MSKTILRSPYGWTPIGKSQARHLGVSVVPLAPSHTVGDVGLVLDRSVWVEMPLPGRWMVAFRLASQGGQPVIAEVRVFPFEPDAPGQRRPPGLWSGVHGVTTRIPPGGITARVLREIRTQAFRADLHTITARWEKETRDLFPGIAVSNIPPSTTRGRKGRSDRELASIAAIYVRAYAARRPSTPAVAKATGLSLTQARDAVHRARVRGLLSPASKQGKGGGLLTPLARKILKQDVTRKGGKRHGTKR